MSARIFLPLVFLGILTASPLAAATESVANIAAEDAAWEKATLYLFKDSYLDFRQLDSREARLGRAALLLLQQPKTEANLDQAVAELEKLAVVAAPAPADEPAISARYLLGRIAQIHRATSDTPAATAHFRQLIAEHPEHFLADQALVKLAIIEIYEPGLTPAERLARIDRYGAQAEALTRPTSRRDLHLALATACAYLRLDDERCLTHYLAADRAGVDRPILRANVTVAIGELASRLGRPNLAREYFQRYLAEFRRDYRRVFVKDKLAALPAPATASSKEASR